MKTVTKQVALLLCSVAVAALSGTAGARPYHAVRHYAGHVAAPSAVDAPAPAPEAERGYAFLRADWAQTHGQPQAAQRYAQSYAQRRHVPAKAQAAYASAEPAMANAGTFTGFGGGDLISTARRYIGTNPTNRSTLWCGAFVDVVLRQTGHKPGSALAGAYLNYGQRVSGPQPGALAVFNGGAHVGIVSGVDSNGNPIIISGNVNRTTTEQAFARNRIEAYVMPGG
jgi:uncharacterized protein (TIGR02594 family)